MPVMRKRSVTKAERSGESGKALVDGPNLGRESKEETHCRLVELHTATKGKCSMFMLFC